MTAAITMDGGGKIAMDGGKVIGQRWMGDGGVMDSGAIDGQGRRRQGASVGWHRDGGRQ